MIKLFSAVATSTVLAWSFLMPVAAQVIPDGTTSTTVDVDGMINNGDRAGSNLFHSFSEFSVPTGGQAFFNNSVDIVNIFSRVTGGNLSNIDGILGANGTANLFLINPAGIIFGENASLDIGGSFFGSTADSIIFPDGEFSALDADNPPLLTINAPLGLGIRDNPAGIVNRATDVGLQLPPGETLALVGGNIDFEGGQITAPGVNIWLGGLSSAGTVNISDNFDLSLPNGVARADISFADGAGVSTAGDNGGGISAIANNITFTGTSQFFGGIAENGGFDGASAGAISLDATGAVNLSGDSSIQNRVNGGATGNSGDINVTAESLTLTEGGFFSASTFGIGDAGDINVDVAGAVQLSGTTENSFSRFSSVIGAGGIGDGGNITINSGSVSLTNGGLLNTSIFDAAEDSPGGRGDAGNININATGEVNIFGSNTLVINGQEFTDFSTVQSNSGIGTEGNAGNITIAANSLSLGSAEIAGDASLINSSTSGTGNAGNINIQVQGDINLVGGNIASQVIDTGIGDGGDITVNATNLSLLAGSQISGGVFGTGNAGQVTVNATGDVTFSGIDSQGFASGLVNNLALNGVGNAGDITVNAQNLTLSDGGIISSNTLSQGNAGNINVQVLGNIDLVGGATVSSNVQATAIGQGGNITLTGSAIALSEGSSIATVTLPNSEEIASDQVPGGNITVNITELLTLTGNSSLISGTTGQGNAGNITINGSGADIVFENNLLEGEENTLASGSIFSSSLSIDSTGQAGSINIDAKSLVLRNDGVISSTVFGGQGNGGDITINVAENLDLTDFSISSDAALNGDITPGGNAGNITINAESFSFAGSNFISSSTFGQGNAGSISVETGSFSMSSNAGLNSSTSSQGNAGDITVNATNFSLLDGAQITTSTSSIGNAGNITVNAESITLNNAAISAQILESVNNSVDTEIFLFDAQGNLLTENDDAFLSDLDAGSDSSLDSLLQFTFAEDGTYTIGVGAFNSSGEQGEITGDSIPVGGNYTLQVSVENQLAVPGTDGLITKIEPNNSLDTAQNINNSFSLNNNPDISNSNSIPNVSIAAEGNGTFDYYSFDATANSLGIFDIDGTFIGGDTTAGDVNLNATGDITISENSLISNSTLGRGDAGSINIQAQGDVTIIQSNVFGQVAVSGIGDGGRISVDATNISLRDGAQITAGVFGTGDAGNVIVNATGDITFSGINSERGFPSGIINNLNGVGSAGDIEVNAQNLNLLDGGTISSSTIGQGSSGNININAIAEVNLSGSTISDSNITRASQVATVLGAGVEGRAGNITINSGSLSLSSNADLNSSTSGIGNSGEIRINTDGAVTLSDAGTTIFNNVESGGTGNSLGVFIDAQSLEVTNGSQIQTLVREGSGDIPAGQGNAGDININVRDGVTFSGSGIDSQGNLLTSQAVSQLSAGATGNAGNLTITGRSLTMSDSGTLNTSTFGNGDAGNITIDIQDGITLSDFIFNDDRTNIFVSQIGSVVGNDAIGNAGEINITGNSLALSNRAQIDNSTFGNGNAGNISLNIDGAINLERSSFINSAVNQRGIGNGGDINIQTSSLTLNSGSQIGTLVSRQGFNIPGGLGNGGNITINATDFVELSGIGLEQLEVLDTSGDPQNTTGFIISGVFSSGLLANSGAGASGDAGNITVTTNSLSVSDGAVVLGSTLNDGNAGNIIINSNTLEVDGGGQIVTATRGSGDAGTIRINVSDQIDILGTDPNFENRLARANQFGPIQGGTNVIGNQGAESGIFANTSANSTGNGGDIEIGIFQLQGENLVLDETILPNEINISSEGRIAADSTGTGSGGTVTVHGNEINLDAGAISATTATEQTGANPSLSAIRILVDDNLVLRNNSEISAAATNSADGGNITIDSGFIIGFPSNGTGSDILANAGQGAGGIITINAQGVLGFEDNEGVQNNINDIDASSLVDGLDGVVTINNPDINPLQGVDRLPTNPVSAERVSANSCSPTGGETNLIIKGKGGIPPEPNTPLTAESLLLDDRAIALEKNPHYIPAHIKPVKTDNGDIYPARGVIVQEDGTVILTAYSIDDQNHRVPQVAGNCNS
ncbi:MAG: filamentous hemagglutinin N-terminal domain-containing protein [Cyanobacteria bacterium P01_F01_bin.143]